MELKITFHFFSLERDHRERRPLQVRGQQLSRRDQREPDPKHSGRTLRSRSCFYNNIDHEKRIQSRDGSFIPSFIGQKRIEDRNGSRVRSFNREKRIEDRNFVRGKQRCNVGFGIGFSKDFDDVNDIYDDCDESTNRSRQEGEEEERHSPVRRLRHQGCRCSMVNSLIRFLFIFYCLDSGS